MNKWFIALVLIGLAIVQLAWPSFLSPFNIKPDLLLVFAVSLVFYFNLGAAIALGAACGLLKDAFLPQAAAINAVLFAVWIYSAFKLSSQISTDDDYARLSLILIAILLNNIVMGLRVLSLGGYVPAGIFLRNIIVGTLYSAAFSPLILKLTRRVSS
jgi:rod shape-determining protein MreD